MNYSRTLQAFLRILQEVFENSGFKNVMGREIDNYHTLLFEFCTHSKPSTRLQTISGDRVMYDSSMTRSPHAMPRRSYRG